MISKDKDREETIRLRKLGYSIFEISKKLGVAKSSVSVWGRDVRMNKVALARINKLKEKGSKKARETCHQKAVYRSKLVEDWVKGETKNRKISKFEQQIICALLYWGEGAKFSNRVEFTNSDPLMVRVFLRALTKGFGVSKNNLRLNLQLHKYHDEEKQKLFWSKKLGLSLNQFNRTFWKESGQKIKRNDYMGCIRICCNSKEIVGKIKTFYLELSKLALGP